MQDNELSVPGYSFVRRDRVTNRKTMGGGVIVYIRDAVNYSLRNDLNGDIECVWIEIGRSKGKPALLIGSYYRPPDDDIDQFITIFNHSLETASLDSHDIVVLGDFNVDFDSRRQKSMKQIKSYAPACC